MDVVIQSEIPLTGVHVRQAILFRFIRTDLSRKQLLPAAYDFGSTHGLLPKWRLTQAVSGFDPVAAAIVGASVFGTQIEGNRSGLPGKMKSKRV